MPIAVIIIQRHAVEIRARWRTNPKSSDAFWFWVTAFAVQRALSKLSCRDHKTWLWWRLSSVEYEGRIRTETRKGSAVDRPRPEVAGTKNNEARIFDRARLLDSASSVAD